VFNILWKKPKFVFSFVSVESHLWQSLLYFIILDETQSGDIVSSCFVCCSAVLERFCGVLLNVTETLNDIIKTDDMGVQIE
jgi:hypothetical protein